MLRSYQLAYRYSSGSSLRFPDVELEAGQQMLLLGPSGSGKTTLLNLWSGMLQLQQGEVQVGDTRLEKLNAAQRDRWRGREVGFVYQSPRLMDSLSVVDNLELPQRLLGQSSGSQTRQQSLAALKGLGLDQLAYRYPAECSQGEQQRIGILRALAHRPTLILADEPTSSLDRDNALKVAELLKTEAQKQGATLVIVTHDDRLLPLFDRHIKLSRS